MAERTRQVTAALTATLGGLAAPSAAHAMLPADAGGGPAPAPPKEDTQKPKKPAADPTPPVKRDPAPPAPRPVVRREAPAVPAQDPVQRRQPVNRTAPAGAAGPARQPQDLRSPDAVTPVRRCRSRPSRRPPAREPQDLRYARRQSRRCAGPTRAARPYPDAATTRSHPGARRARRCRAEQPPAQDRPAPRQPEPAAPEPKPKPPTDEQVQSEAERYANALDQIDADDGALRGGTAQAMRLGDDPRVVSGAKQIREREAAALEAERRAAAPSRSARPPRTPGCSARAART